MCASTKLKVDSKNRLFISVLPRLHLRLWRREMTGVSSSSSAWLPSWSGRNPIAGDNAQKRVSLGSWHGGDPSSPYQTFNLLSLFWASTSPWKSVGIISSCNCGTCRGRHSYQGAGPFWYPEHSCYQTICSSHLAIVERIVGVTPIRVLGLSGTLNIPVTRPSSHLIGRLWNVSWASLLSGCWAFLAP